MTRLLITGASGFIGRQVLGLPQLSRFSEVHAASRRSSSAPPQSVSWHVTDLRSSTEASALVARIEPTHILHLAWNAEHGAFWTARDNERWTEATHAMMDAFIAAGGQRFVGAGTCAEYDWTALDGPCREDVTPLAPVTPYGRAKLRAWQLVHQAAARSRVTAAWGRVFLLYGPGEDPRRLVPSLAAALRDGRRAALTEGTQVRDFLHVTDVAQAFDALLTASVEGAVNIGSGVPVAIRDLASLLGELAGRPELIEYGAVPMRPDDPPVLVADVAKLRGTGWGPRISLRQGLAEVLHEDAAAGPT